MDVILPYAFIVTVIAVVGVGVGILVARPLDRWTSHDDDAANEEPGGDDRPDA